MEDGSRALRTRLLARELAARGHEVTWWTSDFDHFTKRYFDADSAEGRIYEGYKLRFVHGRPYARNISIARHRNHIEIARDFRAKAKRDEPPDAVVCSFPPIELADTVMAFARERAIPAVFDVRDVWPDELVARVPAPLRSLADVAVTPLRRRVRSAARAASAVTGVSRIYRDWGLLHAERAAQQQDRVIPLGYPDSPQSEAIRHSRSNDGAGPCHFLFTGSFNLSVDVALLIEAFQKLPDLDMTATICGTGEKDGQWRAAAQADSRISFTGWINGEAIRDHAARSHAGIVCYRESSLVSLPNKLFEYLSFGLPVINSLRGEAADLVREHTVGWNYEPGSLDSLCQALRACVVAHKAGALPFDAATRLYEADFSSQSVYVHFADLLESLAGGERGA